MYADRHWLWKIFPELFPLPPHAAVEAALRQERPQPADEEDKPDDQLFYCSTWCCTCGRVWDLRHELRRVLVSDTGAEREPGANLSGSSDPLARTAGIAGNCHFSAVSAENAQIGTRHAHAEPDARDDVKHAVTYSLRCPDCGYNPLYMSSFRLPAVGTGVDLEERTLECGDRDASGKQLDQASHSNTVGRLCTPVAPSTSQKNAEFEAHAGSTQQAKESIRPYKRLITPFPPRKQPPVLVLDAGCGVGNTSFPLLEKNAQALCWCCDFSFTSIDVFRKRERFEEGLFHPFVHDLTIPLSEASMGGNDRERGSSGLPPTLPLGNFHYAILLFVLSAMPTVGALRMAVRNTLDALSPKGVLLIYDYSLGDNRQDKFENRGCGISTREWVRGLMQEKSGAQAIESPDHLVDPPESGSADPEHRESLGTRFLRSQEDTYATFFDHTVLAALLEEEGCEVLEHGVRVQYRLNRKTGLRWKKAYVLIKARRRG